MDNNGPAKFHYNVDLNEKVPDGMGGERMRYGRLRDRAFQKLGDNAPFRLDGALYDVLTPGTPVMPTNVTVVRDVHVEPGTNRVTVLPERLAFCPSPGVGVFGD